MAGRGGTDMPMSEIIRQKKKTGHVEINKAGMLTTFTVKRVENRVPIRIEKDYSNMPEWKRPRSKSAQPKKPEGRMDNHEFSIAEKPRRPLLIEETLIPRSNTNMVKDLDREKAKFPYLFSQDEIDKDNDVLLAQRIYPKRFSSHGFHKPARRHFIGQGGTAELSSPSAMLDHVLDFGPKGVHKESSHISLYESSVLKSSADRQMLRSRGSRSPSPTRPQASTFMEDDDIMSTMDTMRTTGGTSRTGGGGGGGGGGAKDVHVLKINVPQRLDNPVYFKAPPRVEVSSETPGSPGPHDATAKEEEELKKVPKELNRTALKDMDTLALACRRGGKTSQAGRSYFNMGVLYDNSSNFEKAIECYKKFLAACRLTKDAAGEALAYNNLGVDYHFMGPKYLNQAIHYYQKHRDIADLPGKFIAHLNLGIAYGDLGESEKSILNHKHALQYSIRLSDQTGESLACANLGVAGSRTGDFAIAKAFMDRHIALSGEQSTITGKGKVFQQLGELANTRGDYGEAQRLFNKAVVYAEQINDRGVVQVSRCNIGVAVGNSKLNDYMRDVAFKLQNASMSAEEPAPDMY